MPLWPKKKEKPLPPEKKDQAKFGNKINIFRISYRLKNGAIPLIAEMIIKSRKTQKDIPFGQVIKNYWQENKKDMQLDEILLIDKIGEE